ncbi:tripartite tricarboxylate transporter substrate binding protein [Diaphorobacter ruginosibacter]|jgi:tripartite-type tricarboxylate transporter receptor subunit TctC|uniref:Tripartite tricarboxylate transporter substrate binding protein n=1 Tax=Diaphorobacter ruginosibacter TaxID=1715720 RepID=A0A7G9RIG6_9BURK|nr:tripartite tricarboxylate transporter substrate binding protein [Diaphorobacter ruginosibacter]MDR2332792.1 tripartite tricarboxylate transporter substrate binding protein [Burkholderiaceae bacterium]QNN55391.1 tripartite tricarboxylate transporter substrate binding protein [Diaphorobacter ruginosibacter]
MTKQSRRQVFSVTAAALAAALCGSAAHAQAAYPSKPITLIVAYPAGGDTDAMARLYADKLSTRLGKPVIVDNRPGASGTIGTHLVSKAAPDGYTLLLAPSTFSIAQFVLKPGSGSGYDVLNGFTPIVQTGSQPLVVAVSGASGLKNVKQMVEQSRKTELSYASPGAGSPMHILGEMFNKVSGAKLLHIPYKGVAPAVNDLIGGHVPVTYMTLGPIEPYVPNGKVVILGVADRQRSTLAPNVPTLAELGYKGVEVSAWQGLFGPKGMSPELVKLINGHMNEILKMPDVASKMATFGALPAGGEPARLAQVNAADYQRFDGVIKELGIQAD